MAQTKASRTLEKAARTAGKDGEPLNQSGIAAKIGCTQGFVSRLLSGKEKPASRALALRIHLEFGIPPDWWDQSEDENAEGSAQ